LANNLITRPPSLTFTIPKKKNTLQKHPTYYPPPMARSKLVFHPPPYAQLALADIFTEERVAEIPRPRSHPREAEKDISPAAEEAAGSC
jgi:hypothetical protein